MTPKAIQRRRIVRQIENCIFLAVCAVLYLMVAGLNMVFRLLGVE